MNNAIINLKRMNLKNFKNVSNGSIIYNKKNEMDTLNNVVGIYGQNGSGKTAVIESLNVLKCLMSGKRLPSRFKDLIQADKKSCSLEFEFLINHNENLFKVVYLIELEKNDEIIDIEINLDEENEYEEERPTIKINKEKLSYSKFLEGKWTTKSDILNYEYNLTDTPFKPKKRYFNIENINKENALKLKLQKENSQNLCVSYIFRNEVIKLFKDTLINKKENLNNENLNNENLNNENELIEIIRCLKFFATFNLVVIKNDILSTISISSMFFSFRIEDNKSVASGRIVKLFDKSLIIKENFEILEEIIKQINIVIGTIIPTLSIDLKNYGIELYKNGSEGYKVELVSCRNGVQIPLKYESDGIKKIIAILSELIAMYNNERILLAIDELDAGIFEYLLGEILQVISEKGKGQFIFTSHNLRALEKLNKDSIIFTTANPENRYITLTNVKDSNNLRDFYLRGILLGGQKEEIYITTNKAKISRAFRKAWRR